MNEKNIDGRYHLRYHIRMASVIKKPNSRFWFAAYRIPQDDGPSKLVLKSTGQTSKTKAKQIATDMERAAHAQAEAEGEQSQRIMGVLQRATEHAARGKLTARRGRELMREIVVIATGGTAAAAGRLIERCGATVVGYSFLAELGPLKGRSKLAGAPVVSLLTYD